MNPESIAQLGIAVVCLVSLAAWLRSAIAGVSEYVVKEMADLKGRLRYLEEARVASQDKHIGNILEQERRHASNIEQFTRCIREVMKQPCGREYAKATGDTESDTFNNIVLPTMPTNGRKSA